MGLFTKKKKEEPKEEGQTGLSAKERQAVGTTLGMSLGSNNLDAVLETFAPNTIWEIQNTGVQAATNVELSIKILQRLEFMQKQQNELKEAFEILQKKYAELKQEQQAVAR